jgi:hypothetical protein
MASSRPQRVTAGVCALYEHGNPFARALFLTKLGSSRPQAVAKLRKAVTLINTTVTANCRGQLYAGWILANPAALCLRLSNPSATEFGPVLRVPLPSGTSSVWKIYISAKAGHAGR